MEAKGISQSELARRMGVTPAQVTKILSGRENMGLKTITKVQSALGTPLFSVEVEDPQEVSMQERVVYNPSYMFIKSEPVEKILTSAYSQFDIVAQAAVS